MSTYNFRQYGDGDFSFATVLNNSRTELGIPQDIYYVPGSDGIYDAFQADITKSYADKVVNLLRRIKVLIYNGQDDFVVNTPGVLNYLNSLNWEGVPRWKRTPKKIWTVHG
jgi:carboxypeptidase C (cathepsin A)